MNPFVLSGVVRLGAGAMNMAPWGGPTARAMAALKLDSSEVLNPVLPAMGFGVASVPVASYLLGRRERNRLAALSTPATADGERQALRAPGDGPGAVTATGAARQARQERGPGHHDDLRGVPLSLVITAGALLTGAFSL